MNEPRYEAISCPDCKTKTVHKVEKVDGKTTIMCLICAERARMNVALRLCVATH